MEAKEHKYKQGSRITKGGSRLPRIPITSRQLRTTSNVKGWCCIPSHCESSSTANYSQSFAIIYMNLRWAESCVLTNQRNIHDPEILKDIDPLKFLKCILALETYKPFITTNMRKINDPETACEPPRASWESLGSFVGASWKFLRASCEPARILQGTACHLLGPPRSLLQPRGSILKNPKTPPGHSYQPLALSWKLPGTQELQTHAPEILFLARKNKDFVFYMKLMYVAAMNKYAPR